MNGEEITHARLRPVQAPRGARAIALSSSHSAPIHNAVEVLGFSDAALPHHVVNVRLVTAPDVAVELETQAWEVFVQDKFGACRMLKARSKGYLKRGEVLYFAWSKARGTRYGYVLDVSESENGRTRTRGGGGGARGAVETEVIDIASDDDDDRGKAESKDDAGRHATHGQERDDVNIFVHGASMGPSTSRARAKDGDKNAGASNSDERVIELELESNSDDEPKTTKRQSAGASARTNARASARDEPSTSTANAHAWRQRAQQYTEFQQPPRASRAPPSMWGGNAHEELRRQAERARVPPPPPEGLSDDSPQLRSARLALKQKHRELVEALDTEVAMRQALQQSQYDFQRTMRMPDHSLRAWHRDHLDVVAGKYQQSQFHASACRSAYQQALAYFYAEMQTFEATRGASATPTKKRKETFHDDGVSEPETERDANASSVKRTHGWDAECEAWATLLDKDPSDMSLRDLRRCATAVGVDVTAMVERDDFVAALRAKRDNEADAFKAKKKKHDEEEATRKKKRDEHRAARRAADEEESAKREAVHQVAVWAMHADLRLFLHRCGIAVQGGQYGKSTKRLLQSSYRKAMLKYHPDRARQKTTREQALASEVTKWITHAWQNLPP